MESNQGRIWELRIASLLIAVVIALMGFSGALATKEQAAAAPAAEPATYTYHDPSLVGLSVTADAEADGNVQIYY